MFLFMCVCIMKLKDHEDLSVPQYLCSLFCCRECFRGLNFTWSCCFPDTAQNQGTEGYPTRNRGENSKKYSCQWMHWEGRNCWSWWDSFILHTLYILKQKGQFYSERDAELSSAVLWIKTALTEWISFFCLGELCSTQTCAAAENLFLY